MSLTVKFGTKSPFLQFELSGIIICLINPELVRALRLSGLSLVTMIIPVKI